ncbi:hypothetical protein M153_4950003682 [Pseudoloma neurophilia]|uniref:Uncharacterized protein n=1 Tax=Pseudoloma neurophilia TaxID=146866 RepID=A0A0R0LXF0_9MICR|nr:hypothetical protein M153_4950003682 [Pseudoloma neurophilia]
MLQMADIDCLATKAIEHRRKNLSKTKMKYNTLSQFSFATLLECKFHTRRTNHF